MRIPKLIEIAKYLGKTKKTESKKFKVGDKVLADERINANNSWKKNEVLHVIEVKKPKVLHGTSGQWVKTNKTPGTWIDAYWFNHLKK